MFVSSVCVLQRNATTSFLLLLVFETPYNPFLYHHHHHHDRPELPPPTTTDLTQPPQEKECLKITLKGA